MGRRSANVWRVDAGARGITAVQMVGEEETVIDVVRGQNISIFAK